MRSRYLAALTGCMGLALAMPAGASDAEFLRSLEGQYAGKGQVRLRTDKDPINVTCSFQSKATPASFSLNGKCRALVLVSRAVGAELVRSGNSYRGSYIGGGSGPARLAGKRNGNTLNLTINWAKKINGDRRAQLSVAKTDPHGLILTTTDRDPKSGKPVITSKIVLQRK